MKPLLLDAEILPERGGFASDGYLRQLGASRGSVTTFVREVLQNCWDAHKGDEDEAHVDVQFTVRELTSDERGTLSDVVFAERAPQLRRDLLGDLRSMGRRMTTCIIEDRGTTGLRGPTRAGETNRQDNDWANFFLVGGAQRDTDLGGGTYGLGRGVLFLASSYHAIVVYTCCDDRDTPGERRLMSMAIDELHQEGDKAFTGRYWWCDHVENRPVPVLNEQADEIAAALGIPVRPADDHGTTVMIIGFELGADPDSRASLTADQRNMVTTRIGSAAAWHLWPKLVARPGKDVADMAVSVFCDDDEVAVPDPASHPVLGRFVQTWMAAHGEKGVGADLTCPIGYKNQAPRVLGTASLMLIDDIRPSEHEEAPPELRDGVAHVALMRAPELIVRYLPVRAAQNRGATLVGCFIAGQGSGSNREHIDKELAAVEPSTHDDWSSKGTTDGAKWAQRIVGQIQRRAAEVLGDLDADDRSGVDQTPLTGLSRHLANMLSPSIIGRGAEKGETPEPRPRPKGVGKPRVVVSDLRLLVIDGQRVAEAEVEVAGNVATGGDATYVLHVKSGIDVGERGNVESEHVAHLGWYDLDGTLLEQGSSFTLTKLDPIIVRAAAPDRAAVRFDLDLEVLPS